MTGARWQVILHRRAQKIIRRMDSDVRARILASLHGLTSEPRPTGVKKLVGYENLFRVRVGDWRIIYAIQDNKLIVLVLEISTRGGAYRDF